MVAFIDENKSTTIEILSWHRNDNDRLQMPEKNGRRGLPNIEDNVDIFVRRHEYYI